MKIKAYVDGRKPDKDGNMPVMISINFKAKRFFVATGMVTTEKFDGDRFPKSQNNYDKKTRRLRKFILDVEEYAIDHSGMQPEELKDAIKKNILSDVIQRERKVPLHEYIRMFADTKKSSTRILYDITARKVEAFDKDATLDIDDTWLDRFWQDCMDSGMKINGAGKELRNIRAVCNWCRKKGYTNNYPFLDYHIVEEETEPNNLSVEDIRRLMNHDCLPWQRKYVDFFMLSIYLAGINPGDLLSLKENAIRDGHFTFVRRKTDKQGATKIRKITLPVYKEAKDIIKRYKGRNGYLLSFMDDRADYRSFVKKCNEALKKVGDTEIVPDKVGKLRKVVYHPILPNITLYSARYSFGSIAVNDLDISEQAVGMCLGHTWAKNVTSHYISTDQKKIDSTVRRVIDYILYEKK